MPRSSSGSTGRPSKLSQFLSRLSSTLTNGRRSTTKAAEMSLTNVSQPPSMQNSLARDSSTGQRGLAPSVSRRNTLNDLGGNPDDRPLRTSQAAICLHSNEAEVRYSTGRTSTMNVMEKEGMPEQLRRMSMAGVASRQQLLDQNESDDEEMDQELEYTCSDAREYRTSTINGRDSLIGRQSSVLRQASQLSRRNSSVLSNRDSRLTSYSGTDDLTNITQSLISGRRSSLAQSSTIELVNQRNDDPTLRKRPSSAGIETQADCQLLRKFLKEEDDQGKALSDTEVDTMAIECKYDVSVF